MVSTVTLLGRLRAGVTDAQAGRELDQIRATMEEKENFIRGWRAKLVRPRDMLGDAMHTSLLVLLATGASARGASILSDPLWSAEFSLAGFSRQLQDQRGQILALFVIAVAAAEAAIGLGLVLALNRNRPGVNVEDLTQLKW